MTQGIELDLSRWANARIGRGVVERLRLVAETGTTENMAVTKDILADIANQIEAQTRPPKPAEPTGLGAVVKDREGREFIRHTRGSRAPWIAARPSVADRRIYHDYAEIEAVEELSKGVPA